MSTTQHAAVCVSSTEPLIICSVPSAFTRYEEVALAPGTMLKASATTITPSLRKAKPNGSIPTEAFARGIALAKPLSATMNVSMIFLA